MTSSASSSCLKIYFPFAVFHLLLGLTPRIRTQPVIAERRTVMLRPIFLLSLLIFAAVFAGPPAKPTAVAPAALPTFRFMVRGIVEMNFVPGPVCVT